MSCLMHELGAGSSMADRARKPPVGESCTYQGAHGYRAVIERLTQRSYRLTLIRSGRIPRSVDRVSWWETWQTLFEHFPNRALFDERTTP